MSARWKTVYWAPSTYLRGHLIVHGLAFLTIAGSMWFQADRYTFGTNQGLLFLVTSFTPREWAVVFAASGTVKLLASLTYPKVARLSLLVGMLLLCWWAVGFILGWLYGGATILGVVAWGLLLGEHFAALTLLDGRKRWREDE
jgi:hypothetical protein